MAKAGSKFYISEPKDYWLVIIGNVDVSEVIKNFNNKQRCDVSLTDAIGREQKTTFLTEQGLYFVSDDSD